MYEESGGRAAPVLADRYRLIAQLGRGGTARVLRAWDDRLGRAVAIKIFQPHADPVGRLRFEDEAKLLAGFDHPGLVKVFDSGCDKGAPYLVLELINGPHLGRRIDSGPMPADEVRKLGIALAEALAYVHSRGVVHRDVKPGNVLLDADGVPHLADFGLAKLLSRTGLTASDRLVGTAAYLSPEQVLGTEVGPPADIYGLGLVLLECVTGEIEYPGLDAETVLARISRRPRIPAGIPAGLASTLEAMTHTEPADRPDAVTCAELLRMDRPTVPLERPRRFTRAKVAVVLGAALTVGAIGLLIAAPSALTPSQQAPAQVEPNQGHAVDATLNPAPVGVPQQPLGQTQRPAAERPPADNVNTSVATTPTVTITDSLSAAAGQPPPDPSVAAAANASAAAAIEKAKKTKTTTETSTTTPSQPAGNGNGSGNGNGGQGG
jgi:serine/threonine protein kinase